MADDPTSHGSDGETGPGRDGADAVDAVTEAPEGGSDALSESADGPEGDGSDRDGTGQEDDAGGDPAEPVAGEVDADRAAPDADDDESEAADSSAREATPPDVRKYERFKKVDGAQYERVNDFLRERTYVTAREWAIARLCADFRTETGVEMTKIGENLPELVPFMEDTYSPQAVNQARSSFEEKVHKAGATFLYGAMCDFFTAEELDELMYEVTEVARFLLEVEGVDLAVEEELAAEDRISGVMREVREASEEIRHHGTECPECGHEFGPND